MIIFTRAQIKKKKCGGLATHRHTQTLKDLKHNCNHLPLGLIQLLRVLLIMHCSCFFTKMPNSTKGATSQKSERVFSHYFFANSPTYKHLKNKARVVV